MEEAAILENVVTEVMVLTKPTGWRENWNYCGAAW